MNRLITLVVLLLATGFADLATADGLIYQLPKDGAAVTYDLELKQKVNGRESTSKGTLTIRSVGEITVDDQKCRWIECKLVMKRGKFDDASISKTLIPEAELGNGKSPLKHVIRSWHTFGKGPARNMKEMAGNGGTVPFLAGPSKDAKELDAIEVDSKLGKLDCPGTSGTVVVEIDANLATRFEFETRLNEKAPFGVVASDWKFELIKNAQVSATGTVKLTIAEVASEAKSDLPDNN